MSSEETKSMLQVLQTAEEAERLGVVVNWKAMAYRVLSVAEAELSKFTGQAPGEDESPPQQDQIPE